MLAILHSTLAFVIGLSVLIFVHELGHFYIARCMGIKVLRFSIGFGPRLFKRVDKKGTEFRLAMIPLGGYVKMLDEREGPVPTELLSQAFTQKSLWARMAVVLAGPMANMLFAVFAFWLMLVIGVSGLAPYIRSVTPHSIAAQAGIAPGDEIVSVAKVETPTWEAAHMELMRYLGDSDTVEMQVRNSNSKSKTLTDVSLNLSHWDPRQKQRHLLEGLGIEPGLLKVPPLLGEVTPHDPAEQAGLRAGDKILAIEGQRLDDWANVVDKIQHRPDQKTVIRVERNGKSLEFTVMPKSKIDKDGKTIGYIGAAIAANAWPKDMIRLQRYSPIGAVLPAFAKTWKFTELTFEMLYKMVTGKADLENVSGPIAIAQGAGASAQIGFSYYLGFLALISVSLGVINLLPIPVLDGGHLLYYLIELVRGKPVSARTEQVGFGVGLIFLLGLMVLAFYNDITGLTGPQ